MKSDPIRGKTIQWTFSDGPMANRTFEHSFKQDGSLTFRPIDGKGGGKPTDVNRYQIATVRPDVYAASYLGSSGYTLTVVLDYASGQVVAFASNEKDLVLQHGTFREMQPSRSSATSSTSSR